MPPLENVKSNIFVPILQGPRLPAPVSPESKKPRITRGFPSTFLHLSVMPEQSQEQDDRQGNAEQPKQSASSETHDLSPSQCQGRTPDGFWCSGPLRQNPAS